MFRLIKNKVKALFRTMMVKFFPELQSLQSPGRFVIEHHYDPSQCGKCVLIYPPSQIYDSEIGDYTYIATNSKIGCAAIGKYCSIGPNIVCGWGIHPTDGISTHPMFYSTRRQNGMTLSSCDKIEERKQITIGNDVFIGANVTVLDGVTIGDGAVIGAGAVVSKDIPPYAVAVGCPIRIIRYRFSEEIREKLLQIKWWDFDEEQLKEVERLEFDVETFVNSHS